MFASEIREALQAASRLWSHGQELVVRGLKYAAKGKTPSAQDVAEFGRTYRELRKQLRRFEHLAENLDSESWAPWRWGGQGCEISDRGSFEDACETVRVHKLRVNWRAIRDWATEVLGWFDAIRRKSIEGFVDARQLWKGRFDSYRAFTCWLDKHPEVDQETIDRRRWVNEDRFLKTWRSENNAVYHGDGRLQIGEETITLIDQEREVVEALVRLRAATNSDLQVASGAAAPHKVLQRIRGKFPALAHHIIMPGKARAGGYRTTIKDGTR
jgi:hypothetical protein